MTYNPNELKEKVVEKSGTQIKGKVLDIREGKYRDFVDKEVLKEWENYNPDAQVINVQIELENEYRMSRVMQIPTDGVVHPKSNMAKWKKLYGEYPIKDQEIFVVADGNGFWNIPL